MALELSGLSKGITAYMRLGLGNMHVWVIWWLESLGWVAELEVRDVYVCVRTR